MARRPQRSQPWYIATHKVANSGSLGFPDRRPCRNFQRPRSSWCASLKRLSKKGGSSYQERYSCVSARPRRRIEYTAWRDATEQLAWECCSERSSWNRASMNQLSGCDNDVRSICLACFGMLVCEIGSTTLGDPMQWCPQCQWLTGSWRQPGRMSTSRRWAMRPFVLTSSRHRRQLRDWWAQSLPKT